MSEFNQTQSPTSATKGNSKNNGNKGKNMPWQWSVLQVLGSIQETARINAV
jgi:hypothetical protein